MLRSLRNRRYSVGPNGKDDGGRLYEDDIAVHIP